MIREVYLNGEEKGVLFSWTCGKHKADLEKEKRKREIVDKAKLRLVLLWPSLHV